MKYEGFYLIKSPYGGMDYLKRENADNSETVVQCNLNDPDIIAYLDWLETEDGKAYLAEKETN